MIRSWSSPPEFNTENIKVPLDSSLPKYSHSQTTSTTNEVSPVTNIDYINWTDSKLIDLTEKYEWVLYGLFVQNDKDCWGIHLKKKDSNFVRCYDIIKSASLDYPSILIAINKKFTKIIPPNEFDELKRRLIEFFTECDKLNFD